MIEHLLSEAARLLPPSDFYVDLPFWGYFAAAVLIYRMAQPMPALKPLLLLACSVCMLLTLPRFSLPMLGVLLGVCLLTFGCARLLLSERLTSIQARVTFAAVGIIANVMVLAFFKYQFVQNAILQKTGPGIAGSDFIFLIGISYASFRAMHFIIEGYKKTLSNPGLLSFLNYMLFFPAFVSGPIHRYNQFSTSSIADRNATFRSDLAAGAERLIHGLFKKAVLTVIVFPYTLKNMGIPVHEMTFWQILLGVYAFALYLYFDFSGYTDLAIGSARIMGFVLPENFNRPFLKANIQQLWANFHISLTSWLTDYIYWPLVRRLRDATFFRQHPIFLSNAAIILTFVACGIWHGDTLIFVLWGFYHGIGLSVLNIYQKWKRKVRSDWVRKYFRSKLSYGLGVALTFNFYAAGLLLFLLDYRQLKSLVLVFI